MSFAMAEDMAREAVLMADIRGQEVEEDYAKYKPTPVQLFSDFIEKVNTSNVSRRNKLGLYNLDFFNPMVSETIDGMSVTSYSLHSHSTVKYKDKRRVSLSIFDPFRNMTVGQMAEKLRVAVSGRFEMQQISLICLDEVASKVSEVTLPNQSSVEVPCWDFTIIYD